MCAHRTQTPTAKLQKEREGNGQKQECVIDRQMIFGVKGFSIYSCLFKNVRQMVSCTRPVPCSNYNGLRDGR